jgi:hypothetical protein
VRKMLRDDISIKELREELDYLLLQYRSQMLKHRLRVRTGILRVFLSFGAGVIENAIKLKLKDVVDLSFQVSDRIVALKDAEQSAPGKEISYLVKAHRRFG